MTTDLFGAPVREESVKLAQLEAVELTIEQFEQGIDAFHAGGEHSTRREALNAWCEIEGLVPAEIASEAILTRYDALLEALSDGFDFKATDPARYATYVTGPISPYWLGLCAA